MHTPKTQLVLLTCLAVTLGMLGASAATIDFTLESTSNGDPDRSTWRSGLSESPELFVTSAANVALADEVSSAPSDKDLLGTAVLTFDKANTGLTGSFTLTATTVNDDWQWREQGTSGDDEVDNLHPSAGADDDWELDFAAESPVLIAGFGIYSLNSHSGSEGGTITVYGEDDSTVLDTFDLTGNNGADVHNFIGIESDTAIGRIAWDDNVPTTDSNFFGDPEFLFIPEPGSLALVLLGSLTLYHRPRRPRAGGAKD